MIFNDLNESIYNIKYDELDFYFSSQFYQDKFNREYEGYLKEETDKLRIKFKCEIKADYMILILLYKKIEKRGFRIEYKSEKLESNNLVFTLNMEG